MAMEQDARNFDPDEPISDNVIEGVCQRAEMLVGKDNAGLVLKRLLSNSDEWAQLAEDPLRYTWLDNLRHPPENSRVLLRTAGTQNEGRWSTPGSLREVEPTAAFFLDEEEIN